MEINKKGKGLGKGLDALIGGFEQTENDTVRTVSIDLVDNNPGQPRKQFDEEKLSELAHSIEQHGIVQPLIVKRNGERYTIIAGERRFRAARKAGLREIPIIVRDMDDREVMEVALIENIQRENLNPIEEAAAISFLMKQHDLTQEEVAKRLSKSRPAIANSVRLLAMPEKVQEYLRSGSILPGHARVLGAITDEELLNKTAEKCAESGWSVRETEEQVKKAMTLADLAKRPRKSKRLSNDLSAARSRMRERLGTRVDIQGDENKGKIVIDYYTSDGLQEIYARIMGEDE